MTTQPLHADGNSQPLDNSGDGRETQALAWSAPKLIRVKNTPEGGSSFPSHDNHTLIASGTLS